MCQSKSTHLQIKPHPLGRPSLIYMRWGTEGVKPLVIE